MRAKTALTSSPSQKSAGVSLEQKPLQAFGDLGSRLCHQKKQRHIKSFTNIYILTLLKKAILFYK